MIAIIRVREDGKSYALCQLDLMRFTEDQVRERMSERGIRDDAFFICGFSDWSVDVVMSLQDAYILKHCINVVYDGDDSVVVQLLQNKKSVRDIVSSYYVFLTSDEKEALKKMIGDADVDSVVDFWFRTITPANALNAYINQGYLLLLSKGFYQNIVKEGG